MTALPEFPNDEFEYRPDPLGRLGHGTWRRRRRVAEPAFALFRQRFDRSADPDALFGDGATALEAAVGREAENQRFDVARVETLLGRIGHLDLDATDGPTGYFGSRLEDAIRRFQKTEGLKVDGLLNPGGPTITTLATRAAAIGQHGESGRNGTRADSSFDVATVSPSERVTFPRRPVDTIVGPGAGGGGAPPPIPWRKIWRVLPVPLQTPEKKESPPLSSDVDRAASEALADDFVEGITKPLERWGDATTQKGNDIVARECRKVLKEDYPDLADKIKHVGGATEDGQGERLSESYLKNKKSKDPRQGSSYPDLTWQRTDVPKTEDRDSDAFAHANTSTMGKRGQPIARERESFGRLVEKVGAELATQIPKLRPGMDEEEYAEIAQEKCREIFGKWLGAPQREPSPKN